jgi:Tfp pilus assembly protein PilZ
LFLETDYRKTRRFNCDSQMTFENLDIAGTSSANIRNYSDGGLYFETDQLFLPGQEVIVGIENSPYVPGEYRYESYRVKIKWFKQLYHAPFKYGYGASLLMPSDDSPAQHDTRPDNLHRPKSVAGSQHPDVRKFPRKPYSSPIFFASRSQYYAGQIRDISRGGLFIETGDAFFIGQPIRLVIPETKFDRGTMIKGKVVRLARKGVGVKFTGILVDKRRHTA